jgi:YidC/Oxa1 family membrane protein insertase
MDDQNRNLLLAVVLSALVFVVWFALFPPPEQAPSPDPSTAAAQNEAAAVAAPDAGEPGAAAAGALEDLGVEPVADAPRVAIDTPSLTGSLSLRGGRLDDLKLKGYHVTLDEPGLVQLLSPAGSPFPYYVVSGWTAGAGVDAAAVPGPDTLWSLAEGAPPPEAADPEATADGEAGGAGAPPVVASLAPGSPVTLAWNNGAGLVFTRRIGVDEKFMFTVTDSVRNTTGAPVTLSSYGFIARDGREESTYNFILHEGVVRMSDGELQEIRYDDLADLDEAADGSRQEAIEVAREGWLGFTDKYWMTTLIPDPGSPFRSVARFIPGGETFQALVREEAVTVAPGATHDVALRVFAGAKEWEAIRAYENDPGWARRLLGAEPDPDRLQVRGFVESIDWGMFFFLTKPMFWLLHTLNALIGNMGWAIIALTLVIKTLVFPLARKSYVSMARMKELQPEMEALRERTGEDRMALQKGMMELYRSNKVNPASGCLPILIQIPIFFALYKVIFVTIELRHAPWFGWIRDLSAPDPSSILNLFGLLPWSTPEPGSLVYILSLGVLPICLGISMWLQQKLNPAPADPTQKMVFAWMPWIFMFMLGSFASGLVLYWIANNMITFTQQYLIMRSHGAKPDVFGNIREGLRRAPKPVPEPPAPKAKGK